MNKLIAFLIATIIVLSACANNSDITPNRNQSSHTTQETQSEYTESTLPENYDGKTEFVVGNQIILPIRDAKNITELYTGNFDDGTHTVFQIEFDAAWVRETTGLSFNSKESPEFFDIPNREYKGFSLDPQKLYYQKVAEDDTYKGYNVKEAKIAFESLSGNAIASSVTFEGKITLYGTLVFFSDDMITFRPFAQGNDFLPILSIGDGMSITWSDEYAHIDDNGLAYLVNEGISGSVMTTLKEQRYLDVELNISELTLTFNDNATSGNTCKIENIKKFN